jgi:hypothetical protein
MYSRMSVVSLVLPRRKSKQKSSRSGTLGRVSYRVREWNLAVDGGVDCSG